MGLRGQHSLLKFSLSINTLNSCTGIMGMSILLFFIHFPCGINSLSFSFWQTSHHWQWSIRNSEFMSWRTSSAVNKHCLQVRNSSPCAYLKLYLQGPFLWSEPSGSHLGHRTSPAPTVTFLKEHRGDRGIISSRLNNLTAAETSPTLCLYFFIWSLILNI